MTTLCTDDSPTTPRQGRSVARTCVLIALALGLGGCLAPSARAVSASSIDWSNLVSIVPLAETPSFGRPPTPTAKKKPKVTPYQRAQARRVVSFARRQKGKRYCWGGSGPRCYDCSGLVHAAYRSVGRTLPRSSGALRRALPRIPFDQARPGDILWRPGHVGLYLGKGWVIHAPGKGKRVKLQRASYYRVALRPGPAKKTKR